MLEQMEENWWLGCLLCIREGQTKMSLFVHGRSRVCTLEVVCQDVRVVTFGLVLGNVLGCDSSVKPTTSRHPCTLLLLFPRTDRFSLGLRRYCTNGEGSPRKPHPNQSDVGWILVLPVK